MVPTYPLFNCAAVGRAISYFYTPSAFGGIPENALEVLKKAISLEPTREAPEHDSDRSDEAVRFR